MAERMTVGILICVAILLILWDVYVAFFNDVDNHRDTISGVIRRWAEKYMIVPFLFGVVMGHFFWPF